MVFQAHRVDLPDTMLPITGVDAIKENAYEQRGLNVNRIKAQVFF